LVWMNLEPALRKALEEFARRSPEAMAYNAGGALCSGGIRLVFLGREYRIYHPGGEVEIPGTGIKLATEAKIILLHYLSQSTPAVPEGRHVSFQELPAGSIYIGPYTNRVIRPLLKFFGTQPEKLVAAGEKIGGKRAGIGDFSVTVPVLPKIPLTFLIWSGDEEFPPSGNILFDSSAPKHLPTEDYVVLGGLALEELRKIEGG